MVKQEIQFAVVTFVSGPPFIGFIVQYSITEYINGSYD